MKSSIIIIYFLFNYVLLSQTPKIYEDFKIPTYDYLELRLYSQDFLNMLKVNDYMEINTNVGGGFNYVNQSREMFINLQANSHYNSKYIKDSINNFNFSNDATFSINKYLTDNYKGFNVGFTISPNQSSTDQETHWRLPITIGAGFGRVTYARPIAWAIAILRELDIEPTDEKVNKIADILYKSSTNYYSYTYKNDAGIYIYKDLNAVTGKPEMQSKLEQILSYPYQISPRWVGYQISVGLSKTFVDKKSSPGKYESYVITGYYTLPIGYDMQLYSTASFSKDINIGYSKLTGNLSLTYDHTYLWTSSFTMNYNRYFYSYNLNNYYTVDFFLKSNYYILNRLSLYGSLRFRYEELEYPGFIVKPNNEPTRISRMTQFSIGASYWVL